MHQVEPNPAHVGRQPQVDPGRCLDILLVGIGTPHGCAHITTPRCGGYVHLCGANVRDKGLGHHVSQERYGFQREDGWLLQETRQRGQSAFNVFGQDAHGNGAFICWELAVSPLKRFLYNLLMGSLSASCHQGNCIPFTPWLQASAEEEAFSAWIPCILSSCRAM